MHTVLAMFDGFFDDPEKIREVILEREFRDVENPVDSVIYPHICLDIPMAVRESFVGRLSMICLRPIAPTIIFARMMPEGVKAPNAVHTDRSMGGYSAHVYLSDKWPEGSGTGFYTHETEGHRQCDLTDVSKIDSKSMDKWTKNLFCQAQFNRLLMHDSSFFHCAEPIDGFGKSKEDSRLVLTCFFN
jgi:hypothetical protein